MTLIPNEIRYQFSARDVVVKFDALRAYKSKTSVKAAHFLDYLQKKFPFKIKAIQIDGYTDPLRRWTPWRGRVYTLYWRCEDEAS